jgi:DNA repair protein RadC
MKDLSPDDRPREKLLRSGAPSLGDNELVALVVGHGTREADALELANEVLRRFGGIGRARAAQLLAAIELGRRTLTHGAGARVQLRSPRDAAAFLLPTFGARPVEQFGIVLLDTRHRVLRTSLVASGTLNSTIVQPRDVFREAMTGAAAAIVVFHNHPSGDPTPSTDDVELTRRLQAAGVLMGIEVVDHIVLGDTRYCSLKEMGKI